MRRLLVHEGLQLGHEAPVLAERQLGLDALLDAGQAHLLQPCDRCRGKRLVCEVGERRAAPERERLTQAPGRALMLSVRECRGPLLRQPLEAAQIERLRPGADQVAGRPRLDRRAQQLAQVGDLALDLRDGGRGRFAAVELVGQPVDRDDPIGVEQQDRQHGALPRSTEVDALPLVEDLERAEDAELELHGWWTDSERIAAPPSMAHLQPRPQEVVMSARTQRLPTGVLCAVIAGLAMVALAAPAGARLDRRTADRRAPVNARGTDVAAADQQTPRPVVNARGTDVAAVDQQAPSAAASDQQAPVAAPEDTIPSFALIAMLAVALGGAVFVTRLATTRRRSRAAV